MHSLSRECRFFIEYSQNEILESLLLHFHPDKVEFHPVEIEIHPRRMHFHPHLLNISPSSGPSEHPHYVICPLSYPHPAPSPTESSPTAARRRQNGSLRRILFSQTFHQYKRLAGKCRCKHFFHLIILQTDQMNNNSKSRRENKRETSLSKDNYDENIQQRYRCIL
jgi:hypothetical protein